MVIVLACAGRRPRAGRPLGGPLVAGLLVLTVGAGCGDSGGDGPEEGDGGVEPRDAGADLDAGRDAGTDAGTDAGPTSPEAALTVSGETTQQSPLVFDGGGSSDPLGEALSYDWDLGDGTRAAGVTVAHAYGEAGVYGVALTVTTEDGRAATATREVTIAALAPERVATLTVRVLGGDGLPVSGATVRAGAADAAALTTDPDGLANVPDFPVGVGRVVRVTAEGFVEQFKAVRFPEGYAAALTAEVSLLPEGPVATVSGEAGGTAVGPEGATVTFPPGAFVDETGAPVTGDVDVRVTPLDVTRGDDLAAFPGSFSALDADGSVVGAIISFGTVDVTLSRNEAPVLLAPGARGTLRIPIYVDARADDTPVAVDDTIPLWSASPGSGLWVREGSGRVVEAEESPTGLVLEAEVGHFSWWNADAIPEPWMVSPSCEDAEGNEYDCEIQGNAGVGSALPASGGFGRGGAWAPTIRVPGGGLPGPLPVPSDRDVLFEGSAQGGGLQGRLVASGTGGSTSSIVIVLEPAVDVAAATRLPPGAGCVTQTFEFAGDTATFSFPVTVGELASVTVARAAGSSVIGRVRLAAPGGLLLATTGFGPQGTSPAAPVPRSGRYAVEVRAVPDFALPDAGTPGDVLICVHDAGAALALDTAATGTMSASNVAALHRFDLTAETRVAATWQTPEPAGALGFEILDAQAVQVARPSLFSGERNFADVGIVDLDAGTYWVRAVVDPASFTGDMPYDVAATFVPAGPTPLSFTDGEILVDEPRRVLGKRRFWSFDLEAGDRLWLSFDTGPDPVDARNLAGYLRLRRLTGDPDPFRRLQLFQLETTSGMTQGRVGPWIVPEAGTYWLTLEPNRQFRFGHADGPFVARVVRPPLDPVAVDADAAATLDPWYEAAAYRFDATAADALLLITERSGAGFAVDTFIYDDDTDAFIDDYRTAATPAGLASSTFPDDGYVWIRSVLAFPAGESMETTFRVVGLEAPTAVGTLPRSFSGAMNPAGERKFYEVTTTGATTLGVEVDTAVAGQVWVYARETGDDFVAPAAGRFLATRDFGDTTPTAWEVALPGAGTFVVALRPELDEGGSFDLALTAP